MNNFTALMLKDITTIVQNNEAAEQKNQHQQIGRMNQYNKADASPNLSRHSHNAKNLNPISHFGLC